MRDSIFKKERIRNRAAPDCGYEALKSVAEWGARSGRYRQSRWGGQPTLAIDLDWRCVDARQLPTARTRAMTAPVPVSTVYVAGRGINCRWSSATAASE